MGTSNFDFDVFKMLFGNHKAKQPTESGCVHFKTEN